MKFNRASRLPRLSLISYTLAFDENGFHQQHKALPRLLTQLWHIAVTRKTENQETSPEPLDKVCAKDATHSTRHTSHQELPIYPQWKSQTNRITAPDVLWHHGDHRLHAHTLSVSNLTPAHELSPAELPQNRGVFPQKYRSHHNVWHLQSDTRQKIRYSPIGTVVERVHDGDSI